MRYAKRANAFGAGEDAWTVETGALAHARPGGETSRLAWSAVTGVRLAYAPTRMKTNRHTLTLTTHDGAAWAIDNMHFAGIGNFEDRSESFTPFVLACVERVAARSPGARARLGSTAAAYWGQLAFVSAMFALLAAVILMLPIPFSWLIIAKLLLIAAMLPVMFRWVGHARPRKIALDPEAFRAALP